MPDKPSIAVLPFDNMSGDAEQEYFSDGITEDIITGLSRVRWLFVIARNSTFTYKGKAVLVEQVARELGVRYVVEGSVRRVGQRIRVTAQLIDGPASTHVWADRYDGHFDNIFDLQDRITANILSNIESELIVAESERVRQKRPDNLDAWETYLRALPHMHELSRVGFAEAARLLREAIELDPDFASAYACLSRCYVYASYFAWAGHVRDSVAEAFDLARKALALDPRDPFANLALGWAYIFSGPQTDAVATLKRALELDPNLSCAHGYLCNALAFLGRFDEAVEEFHKAERGSSRVLTARRRSKPRRNISQTTA